ncbi:hypothetical protein GCM10025868_05570 [Angustibacter aerolatus]|uniref:N-acetyltransferase domain-containing protein n=1 Tax=Angustibacter aerolatus TaxID=1162965 RepID=A0ABQ6JEH6_9ACTN|nr:hypothetical protein [Angustibacter aerolatus]GMA85307.1 hypothetical protein GCM10025868_05570 [Angustibacter aerolatus]
MLTVRDGSTLDRFYERCGYRVVGRHPRAIRLSATDVRDELMLVLDL